MKSSKFIQSPYLEMKLLTNDEFQEYKNHSCQEYVKQGKQFNYDKMALLNKKYLEPKLDEQPETASSQSLEQENTAGDDLTDPTSQNDDIAISQQTDNADATDLNSVDAQRSINADDEVRSNPSITQEPEQNKNESQDSNLSMPTPPADTASAKNVIQGNEMFARPEDKTVSRPQHICSHCNAGLSTPYSLRRHIGTVHTKDWKSPYKRDKKDKNATSKSVILPLPVPMPVFAQNNVKTKPASMPVPVKNPKKRDRITMQSSDDDDDDLQPPSKSFVRSKRKNDDEDGYRSF